MGDIADETIDDTLGDIVDDIGAKIADIVGDTGTHDTTDVIELMLYAEACGEAPAEVAPAGNGGAVPETGRRGDLHEGLTPLFKCAEVRLAAGVTTFTICDDALSRGTVDTAVRVMEGSAGWV